MAKRKHVHTWRCLEAAWSCPWGVEYAEWVRLAGEHPNQGNAWRSHELHARRNYAGVEYDLGGEGG